MQSGLQEQQQPNYLHIYPFRFVEPYPHIYRTFTKGRWIGKPLLATLVRQFKAYPPEYYAKAIQQGKITVNQKKVEDNYILKNGDQIVHISIRTEPPILDLPVQIISQNEDFVIVNKPPSISVHTGGGHHYNTVEGILKYEIGRKHLHVLHRLDKFTSGLLIFAKSKQKVALFHEESGKQIMKKMYFARVGGRVQWQQKTLEAIIQCISHKDGIYKVVSQIKKSNNQKQVLAINKQTQQIKRQEKQTEKIQIKENQIQEKQKLSFDKNQKQFKKRQKQQKNKSLQNDQKDSKTIFRKLWYDETTDTSLVECYPITGRTHQIRTHLQYLGYPIINDVCYGGRFLGNGIIKFIEGRHYKNQYESEKPKKRLKLSEELSPQQWDYEDRPWEIMLHSYQYKFGGNSFSTPLPYWYDRDGISLKQKNSH